MNAFTIAATVLLAGLVPLGIVILRAPIIDAVVALELGGAVVTLVLLCLAEGVHRSSYFDVPVIAAAAVWIGSLVYVRFVGRVL